MTPHFFKIVHIGIFWTIIFVLTGGSLIFYGGYYTAKKRYGHEISIQERLTTLARSDSLQSIRVKELSDSLVTTRDIANRANERILRHTYPILRRFK
jgi:uncharacterized coiled-coil protein SlyX